MIKAALAIAAMGVLAGETAPLAERIVAGDAIIPVTLNGQPGHLRVDPGAPGVPLVSADYAGRAGLKGGMFSLGYGVGPIRAMQSTAVAKLDVGQGVFKRRIGWGKLDYAPIADGTIGPADLPEPVVRFVLRAAAAGERTVALPMIDGGGMFGGFFGLYAQIMVGGQPMRVRFDPYHPRTLATAGAALRLAAAQEGRLSGESVPTEIVFGIQRPVRTMNFARPLELGPLSIATLGVRTNDGGNATGIAEGPPEKADPDEVVVVARGKERDPNHDRLSLGADQLERCSQIVFDKPAKQIRLTCR
ncbi:hypothetical protein ACFOKI_08065 [Sphingomonas qilianensis]|uniref:Uncharacterized protein n=2 Tax=Sphingomonas qilianensis TaxID=1736690 RepID=A0ABU9XT67_9SPHN